MSTFSRREFLKAGGLAAGLVLLPPAPAVAQNCVLTRYSLASNRGRRMLMTYADCVLRMGNPLLSPDSNPRSWTFQWYTHMVRGDRTKAAELSRVFPLGGTSMALANEMWNTCQAHLGQPQQYFLPWHRMYLGYLEEIIRALSGDACFTMPYWDYTDPAQQALPAEFRQRNHHRWGALYRAERYPEINAGTPLPAGRSRLGLNLECMKSGSYNAANGDAGFCANLDGMLHGAVHLDIGTQLGMATVPWAASDPVFWVHHCNVDRIWASWNRQGGRNPADPAFVDKTFVFANGGGTRAEARVGSVLSVPAPAYDVYLARPPGSLPFPAAAGIQAEQGLRAALESNDIGVDGKIELGNKPTTVALATGNGRSAPLLASAQQAPWLQPGATVILAVEGRTATAFVPVAFNVYVHGSRNDVLRPGTPAHVGQVHFFGLESEHGHDDETDREHAHERDSSAPAGRDISFVLRNDTRALLATLDPAEVVVTFVPTGILPGPSHAAVRRVTLVVR